MGGRRQSHHRHRDQGVDANGISDFNFITKARVAGIDLELEPNPFDPGYSSQTNLWIEYTLGPAGFVKPPRWTGKRASPGRIQQAISDIIKARNAAYLALYNIDAAKGDLDWAIAALERKKGSHDKIRQFQSAVVGLETATKTAQLAYEIAEVLAWENGPVALGARVDGIEDQSVPVKLVGIDAGGEPVTFEILSGPARGTLSGEPPDLIYVPFPDAFGQDSFNFRVVASEEISEAATVQLVGLFGNEGGRASWRPTGWERGKSGFAPVLQAVGRSHCRIPCPART